MKFNLNIALVAMVAALSLSPLMAKGSGILSGFQTGTNTAHLTWTASASTGGTVNVYRGTGVCTGTSTFAKIASSVVAGGPYDDSTVTVGNGVGTNTAVYCYYVTAQVNGAESVPSNKISLTFTNTVLPSPPTGLAGEAR